MHKKFEINQTKIKDGCQSGRKVVTHNSKSDLPLVQLNLKHMQVYLQIHYRQYYSYRYTTYKEYVEMLQRILNKRHGVGAQLFSCIRRVN